MLRTGPQTEAPNTEAGAGGSADEDLSARLSATEAVRLVAMANHPSYGPRIR